MTDPNELKHFKDFLKKKDSFDVVLDGLNIAFRGGTKSPKILSAMVELCFNNDKFKK